MRTDNSSGRNPPTCRRSRHKTALRGWPAIPAIERTHFSSRVASRSRNGEAEIEPENSTRAIRSGCCRIQTWRVSRRASIRMANDPKAGPNEIDSTALLGSGSIYALRIDSNKTSVQTKQSGRHVLRKRDAMKVSQRELNESLSNRVIEGTRTPDLRSHNPTL